MSLQITSVTADELTRVAHDAGHAVPVEQSPEWARYDDSLPGRTHADYLVARDGDRPVAALSITLFEGRALQQLWAKQGPIWLLPQAPTAEQERELRDALAPYLRREHPRAALLRLHATHPADDLTDPLIKVFYDRTVVLDLTQSEDELMAGMSKSGRRDLRYGLKNEQLTFTDETDVDERRFVDVIYPVFAETAERGDFALRPPEFYYRMLTELGPDVIRLYTVSDAATGEVMAWAMATVYDGAGSYYYAATTLRARQEFAAYLMVWRTMLDLKARGATTFDFLGCGSDRAPGLASLDGFKLKFTKTGAVDVPGPWDLVLRPGSLRAYHARTSAKEQLMSAGRSARRSFSQLPGSISRLTSTAASTLTGPAQGSEPGSGTTPGVLPVVLDWTLSGYALARAFHERYGLTSIALVPFSAGAVADSTVIHEVRELGREALKDYDVVLDALREVAQAHPDLTVIPLTNNDAYVQALSAARATLGPNVVVPHEEPELLHRISDKHEFAQVCEQAGALTPQTVVLDFAGGRPDTSLVRFPWPIIVKPADSGLYNALTMSGKKKLYEIDSAPALDALVDRLVEAGFTGQMLAQDKIPGDEILSVTLYRARDGRITLARASRVLLQDPRPALLGVPDVQVVTEMPDVIEASTRILETAGYHGFANLDAIRDPRDGSIKFFEINPRYGRNCFYATASGANVAEQLVTDLVEGIPVTAPDLRHELLYTTLPPAFVKRFLPAGADRDLVARLVKDGHWVDPMRYRGERNPKHRAYAALAAWNHARTYRGAARTV